MCMRVYVFVVDGMRVTLFVRGMLLLVMKFGWRYTFLVHTDNNTTRDSTVTINPHKKQRLLFETYQSVCVVFFNVVRFAIVFCIFGFLVPFFSLPFKRTPYYFRESFSNFHSLCRRFFNVCSCCLHQLLVSLAFYVYVVDTLIKLSHYNLKYKAPDSHGCVLLQCSNIQWRVLRRFIEHWPRQLSVCAISAFTPITRTLATPVTKLFQVFANASAKSSLI